MRKELSNKLYLLFSVSGATRTMFDIINEAETRSVTFCEICGDHAKRISNGGWLKTRCRIHRDN